MKLTKTQVLEKMESLTDSFQYFGITLISAATDLTVDFGWLQSNTSNQTLDEGRLLM